MAKQMNSVLRKVFEKITPTNEEVSELARLVENFKQDLEKEIKTQKLNLEIFLGGSYAKGTMVKSKIYDVDIFLRFKDDLSDEEMSNKTQELINKMNKDFIRVHGSRDYFKIKIKENIVFEVVPVKKVSSTEEAENITDLSYSHVKYINKKINSKRILKEIKLAKAFCKANYCYGAESYIKGFSGYGLELLVYYYKSFEKFIKEISKKRKSKIVIDIEKHYKNRNQILMDINESKLLSPIILVDPTFKQRNVLAALSEETFKKFQNTCKEFLKNPSEDFFEKKKTDLKKIKEESEKKNREFVLLEARTEKQEGDVAGSKLLKFYEFLTKEIEKYFFIKERGFNYNKKQAARYYFVVESKKEIILEGPFVKDIENVKAFEKAHSHYFIKKDKIYAKEKVDFALKDFIDKWKRGNTKILREMSILRLKFV